MGDKKRPYIFYDVVISICSTCYQKIEAKMVFQDGNVYLLKRCPQHGHERVLIADDVEYYRRCREVFIKPPDMAKALPIKHLMVNTHGVRVAQDEEFVKRLSDYAEDFEVYLQFDSFEREPLMVLRGADLRRIRQDAIEKLNRYNIATNLVVTLKKE